MQWEIRCFVWLPLHSSVKCMWSNKRTNRLKFFFSLLAVLKLQIGLALFTFPISCDSNMPASPCMTSINVINKYSWLYPTHNQCNFTLISSGCANMLHLLTCRRVILLHAYIFFFFLSNIFPLIVFYRHFLKTSLWKRPRRIPSASQWSESIKRRPSWSTSCSGQTRT